MPEKLRQEVVLKMKLSAVPELIGLSYGGTLGNILLTISN
jgi:hypothetical protein